MSLFSQRKGIRPIQKSIQREAIDDELRNQLWSALKLTIWDKFFYAGLGRTGVSFELIQKLWLYYFKKSIDTVPNFYEGSKSGYIILRDYFFDAQWWQVYDFVEFIAKNADYSWSRELIELCNSFLEAENAAYRFVDKEIVEITDDNEISAIETALETPIISSRHHLSRALELLSDRKQPDYRNSIKESISSVESLCQTLTGSTKDTLGDCLKLIKNKMPIHPALESAFSKLYGYTSDEGGIRHALTESSEQPSYADAKFMLVACSAFNNFLLGKAAENNITVNGV